MTKKFIPTNQMITHHGLKSKEQEGYHRSPEGGIFVRLSSNLWYFVGDEREIAAEDLKAIHYNDKHPVKPGLFRGCIPGFEQLNPKFRPVVIQTFNPDGSSLFRHPIFEFSPNRMTMSPQAGKTEAGECPIRPIEEHDENAFIGRLQISPDGEIKGQADPEMVKRINASLSGGKFPDSYLRRHGESEDIHSRRLRTMEGGMRVHVPGVRQPRYPKPEPGIKHESMRDMVHRSLTSGRYKYLGIQIFKMDPESIAERELLRGVATCHDPAPTVLSGDAAIKFLESRAWLELSSVIKERDHFLARNLVAGGMSYPALDTQPSDPRAFVKQLFSDVVSFIEGIESGFELRALENGLRGFNWTRSIECNLHDYLKGHSKEALELSGLRADTKEVRTIIYPGERESAEEWFESFGHALLRWATTQEIIWPLSDSETGGGYSCTSAKTITHPVDFAAIIAQNHGHKDIKSAVRVLYAKLRA